MKGLEKRARVRAGPEDLTKDAKSLQEWYDSHGIGERYGNTELSDDPPLLIIGCLVKYSQRMKSIVKLRLKPYGNTWA